MVAPPVSAETLEVLWLERNTELSSIRERVLAQPESPERQALLLHLDLRDGLLTQALESALSLRPQVQGRWLARTLNVIAVVMAHLGLSDGAHALFTEQLRVAEQAADRQAYCLALHDLGVFHMQRDPPLSMNFLTRTVQEAQADGDWRLQMRALFNLVIITLNTSDTAGRERWLAELLSLPTQQEPDLHAMTLILRYEDAWARNDQEAMRAMLAELQAMPPSMDLTLRLNRARLESRIDLAAGHPERCVQRMQALLEDMQGEQRGLALDMLLKGQEAQGDYQGALKTSQALTAFWQEFLGGQREQHLRALEVLNRTEHAQVQAEQARQRAADLAALLEEARRAQERLLEQNLRDALTGLPNRQVLLEQGAVLLSTAPQAQLALIGLDDFQSVNERYGHLAGDQLLMNVANLLRQHLSHSDLCARYSGVEFVVIRPDPQQSGPLPATLETFRAALNNDLGLDTPAHLTVSVGVVTALAQSLPDVLARADAQLYAARRAGGNRVLGTADHTANQTNT